MSKTVLITGSTDGIGLEAAKMFFSAGHHVLLHGRNPSKLKKVEGVLAGLPGGGRVEGHVADLSRMADVERLAHEVTDHHPRLEVLINNAGVFRAPQTVTQDGLDVRFVVNTIAPYLLTRRLLPLLGPSGRVINVSSAAQASVDPEALAGRRRLSDNAAYAQSKLALTMWSRQMALSLGGGPAIIALNPGSLLGTKMVREAFGEAGGDVQIGAAILRRAALTEEFATASGRYFDNDRGRFSSSRCTGSSKDPGDRRRHRNCPGGPRTVAFSGSTTILARRRFAGLHRLTKGPERRHPCLQFVRSRRAKESFDGGNRLGFGPLGARWVATTRCERSMVQARCLRCEMRSAGAGIAASGTEEQDEARL